jgi:hypothetical protein
MPATRNSRLAAMVASTTLAAGALLVAAPAATAAPVFIDANTNLEPQAYADSAGSGCSETTTYGPNTLVPVVENGGPVSATGSVSSNFANSGDATDNATGTASVTATGSVTSMGGSLRSMDFKGSGSYNLDQALATSGCDRFLYGEVDLNFDFTVTQPGFLHIKMSNAGTAAYGEVYLRRYQATGSQPFVDHSGYGLKFNGTDDIYLPAGEYRGYFESWVGPADYTDVDSAGTGSTSVHATFAVAGSQTAAQAGKGHKYVTLAGARSCATHSVGASITGKKNRAQQIKQVQFFVNDTKVKKVKTPDKGDAFTLPVADDQAAEVVAEVKLFPKKPGKPAKVVETTASYEACS